MTGVIDKERERQEGWERLGLADPIEVLAAEGLNRDVHNTYAAHPGRAALQEYYNAHPEITPPRGW